VRLVVGRPLPFGQSLGGLIVRVLARPALLSRFALREVWPMGRLV
jgi:hypothetical protein